MPFQNNVLAGASGATGYDVPYSLRFRAANSGTMYKTFSATSTNFDVQTLSFWFKRGTLTTGDAVLSSVMFHQPGSGGNYPTFEIAFEPSADTMRIANRITSTTYNYRLTTTQVFRDPSAWYHCVFAYDSSQATASDRIKLYINGVQVTSFSTASYPAQNLDSQFANNTYGQRANIGAFDGTSRFFDGYLTEINFIDGQALTPSSFGQTDSATGVWVPKKYSGTYGNNGFYLKFADASAATATAIGKDSSGNGNNWTPSGISVTSGTTYDQMTDTPTLNYSVLNPLYGAASYPATFSDANMAASGGTVHGRGALSTFGPNTGKWYAEFILSTADTSALNRVLVLGANDLYSSTLFSAGEFSPQSNSVLYFGNGTRRLNNSDTASWGSTYTTNDNISVAYDADSGKVWFAKNGTWQASGDPAAGTNPAATLTSGVAFYCGNQIFSNAWKANFGQRPFSYTPPTGFKALNSANLPMPSIKKGSLYMDATLRTGTGATASVSSLGFQPDLVWIKSRSAATNHNLFDSSRGAQKGFNSNASGPEYTDANSLTAFSANGYSLGSDASSRGVNINTNTYVDWAWKEGATPGFDVVTYTGNATNRTISHSLGAVPKMMIIKNVDTAQSPSSVPVVYHFMFNGGVNPANYYMYLTSTAAEGAYAFFFNNTAPTSSVFTVGTDSFVNGNTRSMVAYLWSEIEGFSKFGSYTGNGSTDGPFVWCGFRPRYVLIKSTGVENWSVQDSARNPSNVVNARLKPNSADAEGVGTAQNVDFLSNGFKLRTTDAEKNSSSVTYIFAAFAENPFKYSRAR